MTVRRNVVLLCMIARFVSTTDVEYRYKSPFAKSKTVVELNSPYAAFNDTEDMNEERKGKKKCWFLVTAVPYQIWAILSYESEVV